MKARRTCTHVLASNVAAARETAVSAVETKLRERRKNLKGRL